MAAAQQQRPGNGQTDERNAGGHRLSLAEWLVLCLVREEPTYGLVLAQLLHRDGSLGRIWFVQRGSARDVDSHDAVPTGPDRRPCLSARVLTGLAWVRWFVRPRC